MWRSVLITLVLLFLVPQVVFAQSSSDSLLTSARLEYKAGNYGDALEDFRKAYDLSGDARILYNIGRCHEELGQVEQAIDAFQEFLAKGRRAPQAMKDKALVRLKELQAKPTEGTLEFQVNPEGVEVSVDGALIGQSPIDPLSLPGGKHTIRLHKEGYQDIEREIEVTAGKSTSVTETLEGVEATNPELTDPIVTGEEEAFETDTLGWSLVWTGTGLVALGVGLYVVGEGFHTELAESLSPDGKSSNLSESEARELESNGDLLKTSGYISWGLGGASLIGGAVVLLFFSGEEPAVSFGGAPLEGGFVWTLGGRF